MIYVIKIKKYIIPILIVLFTICLIVFSSSNLLAAKSGLILWATSVVPSLFPFFVATELLSNTNIPQILGRLFYIFMKPLFNIGGEGSFAIIMGIISGYPIGAKIACDFRKKNILSKEECERLLSFTNNSGPLFIVGTVGISMFGSSEIGFLLLITHLLACFTVGFIFRFWKKNYKLGNNHDIISFESKNTSFSNLGEVLSDSIFNATSTIMMIGGFIVLFAVIISIFKASKLLSTITFIFLPIFKLLHVQSIFVAPLFTGMLEITNGIVAISSIHIKAISTNIILSAFLLGIGGLSVCLQVLSIVSKTDLSIKPYFIGKILQGIFASFYTFIFIQIFPIFNFNL
ncbi:MAG: sporulation integral membrane protein YlbJ [Clostridia bacterium]|nr:sporulation integral membrane protein YlbJ [Clostridia bacterium]